MQVPFPFEFSGPTAFYLTLYVLTFAVHQAFMHYVLAGSLHVAWAAICPGKDAVARIEQPIAATLRDWMPFLLSAAITAGIAPLLFIQIVYQHQFYTANLLLWWRWMVVIPVLITAFYLLYLLKSTIVWKWSCPMHVIAASGTATCFVFVGFCWTANHLLSIDGASWPEVYASGRLPFVASLIIPRVLVWIGGSFTTMSIIVGWQLWYRQSAAPESDFGREVQTLSKLSWGGSIVAVVAAVVYFLQCDPVARSFLMSTRFLPYVIVLICGLAIQATGWGLQWRARKLGFSGLALASVGRGFCLVATSVLREGLRIHAVDLSALAPRHAQAATIGGFWIFLVAAVVVSALIAWCVRLVKRGWIA